MELQTTKNCSQKMFQNDMLDTSGLFGALKSACECILFSAQQLAQNLAQEKKNQAMSGLGVPWASVSWSIFVPCFANTTLESQTLAR